MEQHHLPAQMAYTPLTMMITQATSLLTVNTFWTRTNNLTLTKLMYVNRAGNIKMASLASLPVTMQQEAIF
jgi:hypothetical protein